MNVRLQICHMLVQKIFFADDENFSLQEMLKRSFDDVRDTAIAPRVGVIFDLQERLFQQTQHRAAEGIVPCVSDHPRPQALAP